MDQQFNLEFQLKSVFSLEFQPEFGIQLGIPILMGINLGECRVHFNRLLWFFLILFILQKAMLVKRVCCKETKLSKVSKKYLQSTKGLRVNRCPNWT